MDATALGLPILVALIAVALLFDFLNGLHDAANSIATVVATRVLRPQTAVIWAAFFNFVAFAVFGLHVAQTVGTGIVSAGVVDGSVIFGALSGAIVWNIVTWSGGHSVQQQSRADRRPDRGRRRQGRARRRCLRGIGNHGAGHRALSAAGLRPRAATGGRRTLGQQELDSVRRRPPIPRVATRFGGDVFARPWRQ